MTHRKSSQFLVACLLAGLLSPVIHAAGFSFSISSRSKGESYTTNRPWGNLGASKQAPQYQPPQPQPGSYYPGAGLYHGQRQGAANTPLADPVVEVDIQQTGIFEGQNLIYTVHVVSDTSIAVLDDKLPRIDGAAMELIDGPVFTTRINAKQRTQEVVNSYYYKLTPLRSGEVVIPPVSYSGTYAANGGPAGGQDRSFSIAAADPVILQVEPSNPAVQPWLPLNDLRLRTRFQQDGQLKAGQPVSLVLELTARGAMGNQLPSLTDQLDSPDYQLYLDKTDTSSELSVNKRHLSGTRRETYTLIPLQDGWIRLPPVNVAWWNVDAHEARLAGIPPAEQIPVAQAIAAVSDSGSQSLFPFYFWAPIIIMVALIAGYLLGSWQGSRPLLRKAGTWMELSGRRAASHAGTLGRRMMATGWMRHARIAFATMMPGSIRLWLCTRCLEKESNPGVWCAEFRNRVCRHLKLNGDAPLATIAERIIATTPYVQPARLRALAYEMDSAVYGGARQFDFPAWKLEVQRQLRPRLIRRRHRHGRLSRNALPALNPRAV